ncbi:MAG TPA: SagB/ThcOx family dehydrogenase [Candidatus Paceibacterota bacterium]
MESIKLPDPMPLPMPLAEAMEKRVSYSGGNSESNLSLEVWGTLLGLALRGRADSIKRNYPSGGALYPVETYVIAHSIGGSAPAAFHYNPTDHALENLWNLPPDLQIKDLVPARKDLLFSSLIVFTSCWKRSSAKYGNLAYIHALLETGHMSENVLLASTALELKSRPMAGFSDDLLITLLDIDAEHEQPIHSIVISI